MSITVFGDGVATLAHKLRDDAHVRVAGQLHVVARRESSHRHGLEVQAFEVELMGADDWSDGDHFTD